MKLFLAVLAVFILLTNAAFAYSQGGGKRDVLKNVKIEKLTDNISLIRAGGGNIAVYHGVDGVFVIDNGLVDKTERVMAAIEKVTTAPVDYLVNTHWHHDHVGNNAVLGKSGTLILANENVRKRMKSGGEIKALDRKVEPAAKDALPVITYQDQIKLHLNDQDVEIISLDPAHTDGDSFIVFPKDNVIHTGDVFFNGAWPFIDASSKGSLNGVIKAAETILKKTNATTKIIPGHGALAQKADLEKYHEVLLTVFNRLDKAKKEGLTKDQWLESKPLADLDEQWGQGFMPTEKFTNIVWDTVQ